MSFEQMSISEHQSKMTVVPGPPPGVWKRLLNWVAITLHSTIEAIRTPANEPNPELLRLAHFNRVFPNAKPRAELFPVGPYDAAETGGGTLAIFQHDTNWNPIARMASDHYHGKNEIAAAARLFAASPAMYDVIWAAVEFHESLYAVNHLYELPYWLPAAREALSLVRGEAVA